jgi:hypothetical protein
MLAPDRSHNMIDAKKTPQQIMAPAPRADDAILQEIVECFW